MRLTPLKDVARPENIDAYGGFKLVEKLMSAQEAREVYYNLRSIESTQIAQDITARVAVTNPNIVVTFFRV